MVFAGSGGQGIITAAIIMAEAAVLYENLIAVQTQDYGAAARGGATRSDVIISDQTIYYPKVIQPNVLICLNQEALNKYAAILRPGGLLITDTRFVKTQRKIDARQIELPMYRTVMDKIENPIGFNICMLGAVVSLTELVKPESILKVMENRAPSEFTEMNRNALNLGIELAEAVGN
jgi:2-oxoglutarate ferredoxin oxidoreductase subunit gamma